MIDEIDRKIIEILSNNARTPYTKIAKEVGLSEGAIRKRVAAMEEKGFIKKYVAVIDAKKLGYNSITLLGVDVEPTMLLEVSKKVAEIDEAKHVFISTGDHMIMAEIWAKNGDDLFQILSKIGKIKGVKRLCPAIILEEIK